MRIATLTFLLGCCLEIQAQDTVRLSVQFVGDIMQHESQMKAAYDPLLDRYDYAATFQHIKPILSAADVTIGNLELTLAAKPYSGYPQFSAPDELLLAVRDAGFDVLVTANNHSADRGRKGIERTIHMLDSIGIEHTGTFTDTLEWLNNHPLVIQRNSMSLSLLNYTYGTNGMPVRFPNIVNRIDTLQIKKDLENAVLQKTDLVIVFFHWGDEYQQMPGSFQKDIASFCLKHGARVVMGSHPHVLQPMEWNRSTDQIVVYSLGNFISGQRPRYRNGGAIFHLDIMKVTQPDGLSKTLIEDAAYSLAWVNRASDSRRTFQIIPVSGSRGDSLVYSPTSLQLMNEFVIDSRSFLERENKGVRERQNPARKK